MIKFIDQFILWLTPGHFEGMLLYMISATVMEWVQWKFKTEVTHGFKGANGMWEAPEWIVYIAARILPHMILASGFLQVQFPEIAWYTIIGVIFFGLTGRFGLEWLLSFKNGSALPPNNPPQ
jgi:hypothetical protein